MEQAGSIVLSGSDGVALQGVELRHLRYFVAVAGAGTFTHAAKDVHRPANAEPADPPAGGNGRHAVAATPPRGRAADQCGHRAAGGIPGRAVLDRARGEADPAGGGPGRPRTLPPTPPACHAT